jgi:ribosomal protein S18 acetylase RimI-like enzyme
MVAFRFCRPDDIPLICQAANECFRVHFPGMPEMKGESLKEEIRELDVWISNAMVARQGEEPVGILMGTKRPDEVLIHRIGVRPGYQRQGIGLHLLTSLSQKLAVLGPPRLVAEVPEETSGLLEFFGAAGYEPEGRLVDQVRPFRPPKPLPEELIVPVTGEELEVAGLVKADPGASWRRDARSLHSQKEGLRGFGVASMEGYGAFVLARPCRDGGPYLDLYAWGAPDEGNGELFLSFLLDTLQQHHPDRALRVPREPENSAHGRSLEGLGFQRGTSYRRMSATAAPL